MSIGVPGLPIGVLRGAFDPDAVAWAAAVTAGGGTYSASTIKAVSDFSRSAKAAGYWTKLTRINLFCGNQLAAALVPLKVGGGSATDTNGGGLFQAGDYTEATGLTGNGTTKYLDTGLLASALTLSDTHVALYNRSSTAATSMAIGSRDGTSTNVLTAAAPFTDGKVYSDQYNQVAGRLTTASAIATPYGFLVCTRTAVNVHTIYRNAASAATNATTGGGLPAVAIYVNAVNGNGTAEAFGSHPCGGYSIGAGLSAADVTAYNTHMQSFQTALGRNV